MAHGGAMATRADSTAGFAAMGLVPAKHQVVTIDLKMPYFNLGLAEKLFAKG